LRNFGTCGEGLLFEWRNFRFGSEVTIRVLGKLTLVGISAGRHLEQARKACAVVD